MRTVQYQDFGKTIKGYVENSRQAAGRYYFFCIGWNVINETITVIDEGMPQIAEIQNFWGKDLSGTLQGAGGVGGLLYEERGGDIYVPFYDNNGNITRYLDANGNTVAQYTYDAFGNTIAKSGALADTFPYRFSTKYLDAETGLYYYGYRYYKPEFMRWLNRDPIGEDGGMNLYAFCQNNAIIYYDPNGESFEDVSNFCAGVGDSLSFGITRLFRRGLNRMIEGTWDDPADVESSSYSVGEYTEVTVEIIVSLGGATLRHAARHSARYALEKSARQAYRRAHSLSGGVVHHINSIKGHPPVKGMQGGQIARFPLPFEWAARGEWNLTWYAQAAEHSAAHRRMMQLESIDKFREITLGTRQVGNRVINRLNSTHETKCWDSVDINVYFYNVSDGNVGVNSIPESVSIYIDEYGRE